MPKNSDCVTVSHILFSSFTPGLIHLHNSNNIHTFIVDKNLNTKLDTNFIGHQVIIINFSVLFIAIFIVLYFYLLLSYKGFILQYYYALKF